MPPTQSLPRMIAKVKENAKLFPLQRKDLEVPTNQTTTVAFPDGEEKVIVMTCGHSMFMNCVLLTKDQLGADVL